MTEPSRIGVVIVEDEPNVRAALCDLVRSGASLTLLGDGVDAEEGMALIRAHAPDVAVVDVRMPKGGGPRVAREVRGSGLPTAVIALSAHGERSFVLEMLRAGAVGYLVKGAPREEILTTIERAAQGEGALSTEVTGEVIHELAGHLEEQEREAAEQRRTRSNIRQILRDRDLRTVFQPVFRTRDLRWVGVEALTSFPGRHPEAPLAWFRAAWAVGLGVDLEIAALGAAVEEASHLPPQLDIFVNTSTGTILSPRFRDLLERVPLERVIVEITEHARVEDYEAVREALTEVRRRGGRVAIDDAGAGSASLRHIVRLAPDVIKLDREITRDVDSDRTARAMARALIAFANETSASLIAEGIETPGELAAVRDLGVGLGQGRLVAPPLPLQRLLAAMPERVTSELG